MDGPENLSARRESLNLEDVIFIGVILEQDANVPLWSILHQVLNTNEVLLRVTELLARSLAGFDVGIDAARCVDVEPDRFEAINLIVPFGQLKGARLVGGQHPVNPIVDLALVGLDRVEQ